MTMQRACSIQWHKDLLESTADGRRQAGGIKVIDPLGLDCANRFFSFCSDAQASCEGMPNLLGIS